MNSKPIGIFDSGIGGLSVVREIKKLLPNESIVYLADKKNFPYGESSTKRIKENAEESIRLLLPQNVKLIVIACNTATVNAVTYLRKVFKNIDIVGTEPMINPAAKISKKGIVILSTKKAASSHRIKSLIRIYSNNIKVFNIATRKLSEVIELQSGSDKIYKVLNDTISKKILKETDVAVLGCTHFPLVKDEIQKFVGSDMVIIDSGEAVARRVKFLLEDGGLLSNKVKPIYKYFTTGKKETLMDIEFDELN